MASRLIGLGSPAAALRRAVPPERGRQGRGGLPLLARAAKAGNAEAEYRVARCYLEGSGVPASRTEGARWLERAAGRGHIEAQTLLAALCVNGLADLEPLPGKDKPAACLSAEEQSGPDYNSALKWSRQAAEAGSVQGQAMLAYVLTEWSRRRCATSRPLIAGMSAPPPPAARKAASAMPSPWRPGRMMRPAGARCGASGGAPPRQCCQRRSISWGCWRSRAWAWRAIRLPPWSSIGRRPSWACARPRPAGVWR